QIADVAVELTTVAVETSEGHVQSTVREGDRRALLLGGDVVVVLGVGVRRVDVAVPDHVVALQADRNKPVPDAPPVVLAGQLGLLGNEDLAAGGIYDRRTGDPERIDIAATETG